MGAGLHISAKREAKAPIMRLPTMDDAGGQPASADQAKEPDGERNVRGAVLKGHPDRIPMPMMLIFSALMDASRT
jgi:hypothetical protein